MLKEMLNEKKKLKDRKSNNNVMRDVENKKNNNEEEKTTIVAREASKVKITIVEIKEWGVESAKNNN
jgi:hypothetical protein